MKRLTGLATAVLLSAVVTTPVRADPGHERPKITVFEFLQPPLKAGINETLKVVAHDPNSWIQEIQVQWQDENGDGGVVFAHTFCVQDPDYSDPGTPARLEIPILFDHPGSYHVEVRALSARKCQPGNDDQTSRTLEKDVVVKEVSETRSDPDDSAPPFDIASIEQTQESSETSATTEIVHRVATYEAWENDALAGPAYMEMYFDLDSDSSTVERILIIDLDESDPTLTASMLDPNSGQSRGYALARRVDDKTIEVRFPPLLLKKGLRAYGWYAYVDSGAQELCAPTAPCTDRAPDSSLMRHRL